jgi:glycosyltransferase involved in cell wall biosynthesis
MCVCVSLACYRGRVRSRVAKSLATPCPGDRASVEQLDVVILTKNEEANIRYALESVVHWARRVFVVDSGSTDRTTEIAGELGAVVVTQPWLGYARQKNWALDNLALEAAWLLILDADERVMPDLQAQIQRVLAQPADQVREAGFLVNRYFVFLGRPIRHCGYYPSYNLRFFKRGRARYEEREVHEHMVADGPVGTLDGHLEHHDRRGLEEYMAKHNRYSTLEARELLRVLSGKGSRVFPARLLGNPPERRRWIKQILYPRLPAKWMFRFLFMYVVRGGFLDGCNGLRFSLFMSAYELLIDLKLAELRLAERDGGWSRSA